MSAIGLDIVSAFRKMSTRPDQVQVRFEERWVEVLSKHGLTTFHMTDLMSGKNGFEAFQGQPDRQNTLLLDLVDTIRRNVRFSVGTSVITDAWRAVDADFCLRECRLSPYAIGAFSVMNKTIRRLGKARKNYKFSEFVFERGDSGQDDFMRLMDRIIDDVGDRLRSVRPRLVAKGPAALQAADFAMWETRLFIKLKLQGTLSPEIAALRGSLQGLLKVPNDWGVMSLDHIKDWAQRIGVPRRDEPWDRKSWRPQFNRISGRLMEGRE